MRRPAESTHGYIAVGLLLGMALATPARAVDGVIEINQAKAKVGGVTPGDTPLFPVTISQPGSYRLTSNLDVTDASARPSGTLAENTTAIQVTVDNVTIDLNGFMIKGPTVCSGAPLTCSPTGSGIGIDVSSPTGPQTGSAVMNGTVQGMGLFGIIFGTGVPVSRAEKVLAVHNGLSGISAARVTDCMALYNGGNGILGNAVTGSIAYGNSSNGILASTLANSEADSNGVNGVVAALTVTNSTATSNGSYGILATTVTNSTAERNGLAGINATTVTGCTATSNGIYGIFATTATGCTANGNGVDQVHAPGITGQNMCDSPAVPCP